MTTILRGDGTRRPSQSELGASSPAALALLPSADRQRAPCTVGSAALRNPACALRGWSEDAAEPKVAITPREGTLGSPGPSTARRAASSRSEAPADCVHDQTKTGSKPKSWHLRCTLVRLHISRAGLLHDTQFCVHDCTLPHPWREQRPTRAAQQEGAQAPLAGPLPRWAPTHAAGCLAAPAQACHRHSALEVCCMDGTAVQALQLTAWRD